jgi:hypothetical protein
MHRAPGAEGPARPFASQLLTAGVQLGYISQQLGHADVAVTARHHARWLGGSAYREPLVLELGEVPADFLARLPKSRHRRDGRSERIAKCGHRRELLG